MVNTSRQSVNTFEDGADDDDDHDEYENQKKTVISLEIIKATGIKLGKETYVNYVNLSSPMQSQEWFWPKS